MYTSGWELEQKRILRASLNFTITFSLPLSLCMYCSNFFSSLFFFVWNCKRRCTNLNKCTLQCLFYTVVMSSNLNRMWMKNSRIQCTLCNFDISVDININLSLSLFRFLKCMVYVCALCLSSESVFPEQQRKSDSLFYKEECIEQWPFQCCFLMKYAVRFCCCPGQSNVCSSQTSTLLLFPTFQLAWFVQMFSTSYLQRQYYYIMYF